MIRIMFVHAGDGSIVVRRLDMIRVMFARTSARLLRNAPHGRNALDQWQQRAALVEELVAAKNYQIAQAGLTPEQSAISVKALQDARNRIMGQLGALNPQK